MWHFVKVYTYIHVEFLQKLQNRFQNFAHLFYYLINWFTNLKKSEMSIHQHYIKACSGSLIFFNSISFIYIFSQFQRFSEELLDCFLKMFALLMSSVMQLIQEIGPNWFSISTGLIKFHCTKWKSNQLFCHNSITHIAHKIKDPFISCLYPVSL